MTTVVAICNLALSHLGDDASVSQVEPPEGSPQAEHCALFYPMARDALLEMHPWNFATRRTTLAVAATQPNEQWAYGYSLPSNIIGVFTVGEELAGDDDLLNDYEIETDDNGQRILYTAIADARIKYSVAVTDPVRFSPLFTTTLSYLLASYLAGPVLKGETGRTVAQAMLQTSMGFLEKAKTSDAAQRRNRRTVDAHTATWMANR